MLPFKIKGFKNNWLPWLANSICSAQCLERPIPWFHKLPLPSQAIRECQRQRANDPKKRIPWTDLPCEVNLKCGAHNSGCKERAEQHRAAPPLKGTALPLPGATLQHLRRNTAHRSTQHAAQHSAAHPDRTDERALALDWTTSEPQAHFAHS
mmetsp:Transcript_24545/g.67966  ORF Transcript_24545/g.67966 Transcript_24545/m.67966 type:complete len:152 (+) Transcript_24545:52-507(+)